MVQYDTNHRQPRRARPLRTIRRAQLMSQRDLALKAHITPSTIYLIETGRSTQPRLKIMRAISDALGVQPREIEEFRNCLEQDDPQTVAAARRALERVK